MVVRPVVRMTRATSVPMTSPSRSMVWMMSRSETHPQMLVLVNYHQRADTARVSSTRWRSGSWLSGARTTTSDRLTEDLTGCAYHPFVPAAWASLRKSHPELRLR